MTVVAYSTHKSYFCNNLSHYRWRSASIFILYSAMDLLNTILYFIIGKNNYLLMIQTLIKKLFSQKNYIFLHKHFKVRMECNIIEIYYWPIIIRYLTKCIWLKDRNEVITVILLHSQQYSLKTFSYLPYNLVYYH